MRTFKALAIAVAVVGSTSLDLLLIASPFRTRQLTLSSAYPRLSRKLQRPESFRVFFSRSKKNVRMNKC
jgi:hypothetical protein